jgi:holin-like protein
MLFYLTMIFVCHFAGEFIVSLTDIPIPGPVIGMLLLFIALIINGSIPEKLNQAANALLSNLSLLFIPAGVGVMLHFTLIQSEIISITAALVLSTVCSIAVTGIVMAFMSSRKNKGAQ